MMNTYDYASPVDQQFTVKIRSAEGCPHNECAFCSMYKLMRYRTRKFREIRADVKQAVKAHGPQITSLVFPDANFISLKTTFILSILKLAQLSFPNLREITCSGSPKYLRLKSSKELTKLREQGLTTLLVGVESGDEQTLRNARKGVTVAEVIEGCSRAQQSGIDLAVYIMIGLGGQERTVEHARATAEVINTIRPASVRLSTTVPLPGTLLQQEVAAGRFRPLKPFQCLQETRTLLEKIVVPVLITGEKMTGYLRLHGRLPEDRRQLLQGIDYALTYPETSFDSSLRCL